MDYIYTFGALVLLYYALLPPVLDLFGVNWKDIRYGKRIMHCLIFRIR